MKQLTEMAVILASFAWLYHRFVAVKTNSQRKMSNPLLSVCPGTSPLQAAHRQTGYSTRAAEHIRSMLVSEAIPL
jgi:hypothetical protein